MTQLPMSEEGRVWMRSVAQSIHTNTHIYLSRHVSSTSLPRAHMYARKDQPPIMENHFHLLSSTTNANAVALLPLSIGELTSMDTVV